MQCLILHPHPLRHGTALVGTTAEMSCMLPGSSRDSSLHFPKGLRSLYLSLRCSKGIPWHTMSFPLPGVSMSSARVLVGSAGLCRASQKVAFPWECSSCSLQLEHETNFKSHSEWFYHYSQFLLPFHLSRVDYFQAWSSLAPSATCKGHTTPLGQCSVPCSIPSQQGIGKVSVNIKPATLLEESNPRAGES